MSDTVKLRVAEAGELCEGVGTGGLEVSAVDAAGAQVEFGARISVSWPSAWIPEGSPFHNGAP
ncbi:MAG TPA: hypothetical protein VMA71_00015, partial [Alloacidobacterium sp.]|nr:hypothetical protein [Alloacidobacterium sp.]